MTENDVMGALFAQQRIQILHIGKHHDEFSDAYLHAWESGVYPLMSDTDGSVPVNLTSFMLSISPHQKRK